MTFRRASWSFVIAALSALAPLEALAEEVPVPDVRGLSYDRAEEVLQSSGLRVGRTAYLSREEQRSTWGRTYPDGLIVQQDPPPAEPAAQRTAVWLRIAGPAPAADPGRITTPTWAGASAQVTATPPPPPPPPYDLPTEPQAPPYAQPQQNIWNAGAPVPLPVPGPRMIPMPRGGGGLAPPGVASRPTGILRRCREVTIEGIVGLVEAPRGAYGGIETGLPNQMRWDGLSYSDELLKAVRFRVGARYGLGANDALELRGGWFTSLSDSTSASGVFAAYPGLTGTGMVSNPNTATLTSEAELFGAELSYIRRVCSACGLHVDALAGARFVEFDETASATDWASPFPGLLGQSFVESRARNDYIAAQLGVQFRRDIFGRSQLRLSVKGMAGSMTQDLDVHDEAFFAPGAHRGTSKKSKLAFGGELEAALWVPLSGSVGLTGGYSLLLLDNVVRANDAMDFTRGDTGAVQPIHRGDTLVVHMFFLGLSFDF